MKNLKHYALLALDIVLSYFPRPLPVGMTAFKAWSNRIIRLVGPLADEDSLRFALSSQIMHLGPQKAYQADQYFIRSLRKTAANQVAHAVLVDLKNKQQERAAAQQTLEATATEVATSDHLPNNK